MAKKFREKLRKLNPFTRCLLYTSGFSSSSNEGIRPNSPRAVSSNMTDSNAKGAKTTPHIHFIVFGLMPAFFLCAIGLKFALKIQNLLQSERQPHGRGPPNAPAAGMVHRQLSLIHI